MGDVFIGSFLLGAAVWDKKCHRIPNWWILLGILAGTLLSVWEDGLVSAAFFILAATGAAAVFFPVFVLRMMGAGDIKVMAVACGYLGFSQGSMLITYGFLAGAIFSAVKLIQKDMFFQRFSYFFAYFRQIFMTKKIVPYYLADRDGREPVIHFAVCLWLGWGVALIRRRLYL